MKTTEPEVFIIESLKWADEDAERREGYVLFESLRLAGKKPLYTYFRTAKELSALAQRFSESRYRYLHLSCHGDKDGLAATLDDLPFARVGKILNPALDKRRFFVSACESANARLAQVIMGSTKCYSLVGPKNDVRFADAAVLWTAFYHLMFQESERVMKRAPLLKVAECVALTFGVPLNCYVRKKGRVYDSYSYPAADA